MKNLKELTMLYIDFDKVYTEEYLSLFSGYFKKVYFASSGDDGYRIYNEKKPQIIVVEPLVSSGLSLIKKVREEDSEVDLLALTEYSSTEMLREMIDLHFLSYLVKPVGVERLESTFLKLSNRVSRRGRVQLDLYFQWDTRSKTLLYKDGIIALTKRESKLFNLLVTKKGNFCSDNDIFFYVWSDDFNKSISNSSIRTLIKNLRRKLPKSLIENKYGLGYRIIA